MTQAQSQPHSSSLLQPPSLSDSHPHSHSSHRSSISSSSSSRRSSRSSTPSQSETRTSSPSRSPRSSISSTSTHIDDSLSVLRSLAHHATSHMKHGVRALSPHHHSSDGDGPAPKMEEMKVVTPVFDHSLGRWVWPEGVDVNYQVDRDGERRRRRRSSGRRRSEEVRR